MIRESIGASPCSYSCRMDVSVIRTLADNFDVIFNNRTDSLINGLPIGNSADLMMLKLGDTIFPLYLRRAKDYSDICIKNHEQILERWDTCSQGYLSHNTDNVISRYIRESRKNLVEPIRLLQSVLSNSAIQIITCIRPETFVFKAYNLRQTGDVYNFKRDKVIISQAGDETFCKVLDDEINVSYHFHRMALFDFKGTFTVKSDHGHHKLSIGLSADSAKRLLK